MADATLKLDLVKGESTTEVFVGAKLSPGPSGDDVFTYTRDVVVLAEQPEIDNTALHTEATLRSFLAGLVGTNNQEVHVTILAARLPRLRELLDIPADAAEFEIRL